MLSVKKTAKLWTCILWALVSLSVRAEELRKLELHQVDLGYEILKLQEQATIEILDISEKKQSGQISLINLQPSSNSWYLLRVVWPQDAQVSWYHLQNPKPHTQVLELSGSFKEGLVIRSEKNLRECALWSMASGPVLRQTEITKKPFSKLCDSDVYLRNTIEGYRTTKEWVVEFLRDEVWGGETITNIVKSTIYKDRYFIEGSAKEAKKRSASSLLEQEAFSQPLPAELGKDYINQAIDAQHLAIPLERADKSELMLGRWYPTPKSSGVFVSVMEAKAAHENILTSFLDYVDELDELEAKAVNYLVAFDLDKFDLNFSVGTEHPRVDWSSRVRSEQKDEKLKGPDGFGDILPLAATGLIMPHLNDNLVATFTGGFKRSHGAFHWGKLAESNQGHHYGFIEEGVILSRLQPELATLLVDTAGRVSMKTWQVSDNENLQNIRYARQNGVPIIEWDEESKKGIPGSFVSNWTLGNWSGSQDMKFRSLRAGMCIQESEAGRYLIYGYFSSVTPTAMARVFQAYGCRYAMHLDMNALEHTYLAVYAEDKSEDSMPSHLLDGMKVLDERFKGNVPRFIGYPDNRDFFFFTRGKAK